MSKKNFKLNEKKITDVLMTITNVAEFSAKIGISRPYFYKLKENSENISVNVLSEIANYFNKPMWYFFDEELIMDSKCQERILEQGQEILALGKEIADLQKEIEYLKKIEVDKTRMITMLEDANKELRGINNGLEDRNVILKKNIKRNEAMFDLIKKTYSNVNTTELEKKMSSFQITK